MAAMFTKNEGENGDDSPTKHHAETVIGPSVKVEGTFQSEDNIYIEGHAVGTLSTSKDLTVGKNARIKADVTAANMHVSGEVRGNLKASGTIQLTASARVYGDVTTQIISIETGAIMQGHCVTGEAAKESTQTQPPSEKKKGAL